jgi:hypothetical protein
VDFKVRCVKSNSDFFKEGNVYEASGGVLKSDRNWKFTSWSKFDDTFENLYRWFKPSGVEFEEVKEEKHEDPLERIKETFSKFKGVSDMKNLVTVKNVIFNPPATIIHWSDNTKSVVKCQNDEVFDGEKGFVMAYLKKLLGNDNTFNKEITKWVKYEPPVEKVVEKVEEPKTKHRFKVGDKVRGHGSAADFNEGLDYKVGTIVRINTDRRLQYCIEYEPYFYLYFAEDQLELVKEEPIEPIEPKPVKKDRYEPGDKVKLIDHRGKFWNHEGKMDEYCDKVLTVKARSGFSDTIYTMEECPRWAFDYYDIVGVVEDTTEEEPKSEYYNGKVVCTDNKYNDFYHINEFTIGKVYDVVDGRIKGDSGWSYYDKAKSLDKLCAWMGTTFIPIKE